MPISTDSALPENRVKISEDLRSMNVPTGEQVLGCVGDAWVRRVWFDMPRYCDGTDLSGYTLSVNYRNTDEDEDRYPVSDAVVNADTITFSWLVGAVACAAPGLTSVSIKAQKLNGDTIEHEFNSTIYYFKVLPANTTGAEPLQEYSDAFTTLMLQWQAEVDEAVAEAPKGKLVGTASGTTPQTVNDAWPTTPESAVLYGKSVQDGTPTPENPVPVEVVGGNLFDISEAVFAGGLAVNMEKTATGVKFVAIGGSGTQYSYDTNGQYAPGAYVLSDVPSSPYPRYFIRIRKLDDSGWMTSDDASIAGFSYVNYYGGWYKETGASEISFSIPNCKYWNLGLGFNSTATPPQTIEYIKLEVGTHATPYTPYGCIGLQIGETVTPIDLQGYGIPEGDLLRVDSTGHVTIEQGETPTIIDLGTIELPELTNPCTLAFYASLDPEWAIQYEQDPNIVVNALQSSIAPVEGGTASTNYTVNSYLIHANQLYRVTSAIATGEAITPGSNCVACTVMGEVIRLTA